MAGIYIHIPFCESKCIYCDFFSVVNKNHRDEYVDAVLKEARIRQDELGNEVIHTLYLGGGTPSVLPINDITHLINGLREVFDLSQVHEFTFEMNPDDVSEEYIHTLKSLGVNRISMGVQTFNNDELKFLHRRHDATIAIKAFHTLRKVGFDNINLDLIFGLPNQTMQTWQENVQKVIELNPEHISCYSLMYEEGTILTRMLRKGEIEEINEDVSLEMYEYLTAQLKDNGYEHYEISNYARKGYHSRHNSAYWNLTPYFGLGAGAHSFDGEKRRYNPNNTSLYISNILKGKKVYIVEDENIDERYNDFVMTALRTMWGLDETRLKELFKPEIVEWFQRSAKLHIANGTMNFDGKKYILTEKGIMQSDSIFRDLFRV